MATENIYSIERERRYNKNIEWAKSKNLSEFKVNLEQYKAAAINLKSVAKQIQPSSS